jgi:NAD(P)-dependent dehydrogenase (short-subunit alcohol dehydrogenase family)
MEPHDTLDGKVAIVTGAGSSGPGVGTGKAISVLLARAGAKVALVDKFPERAEETLALIVADGGEAVVVPADLAEIPA